MLLSISLLGCLAVTLYYRCSRFAFVNGVLWAIFSDLLRWRSRKNSYFANVSDLVRVELSEMFQRYILPAVFCYLILG